jgi:chromate transporter
VALSNPLIPKMRNSKILAGLLDGLNAVSIGLMAAVTWQLGSNALIDLFTLFLALISLFLLVKIKINPSFLIIAGGLLGFLSNLFR